MSNNTKFQCVDNNGNIIYKIDSETGINTSLDVKFNGNTSIGATLSVDSINLKGTLSQNGSPFIGSNWTKTDNNLSYTSGNVIIGGTLGSTIVSTGSIYFTGDLYKNGVIYPSGGSGGGESYWTQTGLNISYNSGNVGIGTTTPTEKLHVVGKILASDDITAFSDQRLKKDIIQIDNALSKTLSLRGVYYKKINQELDNNTGKSIGLIAQEVEKVIPEVVNNSGEYKSLAYGNIVGLLVEAIKELNSKVETLEKKINNN